MSQIPPNPPSSTSLPQGSTTTPAPPTTYEQKLAFWMARQAYDPRVKSLVETYYQWHQEDAEKWLNIDRGIARPISYFITYSRTIGAPPHLQAGRSFVPALGRVPVIPVHAVSRPVGSQYERGNQGSMSAGQGRGGAVPSKPPAISGIRTDGVSGITGPQHYLPAFPDSHETINSMPQNIASHAMPIPTPTTSPNSQFPKLTDNSTFPTATSPKNAHYNALKRKRAQSLETEEIEEEDIERRGVEGEDKDKVEKRRLTQQEASIEDVRAQWAHAWEATVMRPEAKRLREATEQSKQNPASE